MAILKLLLKEGSAPIIGALFHFLQSFEFASSSIKSKVSADFVSFSTSASLYIMGARMATLVMERQQTIDLLKCGDSKTWEDVVLQYQVPLSRYLYNMVRDKELARDLTQDTFLEA